MGYRFNNAFAKVFDAFYVALNLTRNLLVRGLNVANFNFCLPEFAPSFFCHSLHGCFAEI